MLTTNGQWTRGATLTTGSPSELEDICMPVADSTESSAQSPPGVDKCQLELKSVQRGLTGMEAPLHKTQDPERSRCSLLDAASAPESARQITRTRNGFGRYHKHGPCLARSLFLIEA